MDKLQHTGEQRFKWGRFQWLVEPRNIGTDRLSAGLVTFEPGAEQEYHRHHREEQLLYVVSGSALHTRDGVEARIKQGDILHIPQNSGHRVYNDTDQPLVFLIVYAPVMQHFPLQGLAEAPALAGAGESAAESAAESAVEGAGERFGESARKSALAGPARLGLTESAARPLEPAEIGKAGPEAATGPGEGFLGPELARTIQEFMVSMSEALNLSLTLLDPAGNFVLKTDNHPEFCRLMAGAEPDNYCLRRLKTILPEAAQGPPQPLQFTCCNNIASTIVPIVHEGRVQAFIKCGEIFLSEEGKEEALARSAELAALCGQEEERLGRACLDLPVERKSVLHTASAAILTVAARIVNLSIMNKRQKELDASRLSLTQAQLAQANLEKSLREADLKILQAQVAPHFLFNTLSTIAQAAYLEGADKAGELAWHLSDLLRFTLRKTERLISLSEELDLLMHYISIQRERFGDRLGFEVEAAPEAGASLVPCLILQPLVENSILHGFSGDKKRGKISVQVKLENGRVRALVSDDGCGFDLAGLQERTDKIGLHSSRLRLQHYFGPEAQFSVKSRPGRGASVEMSWPAKAGAAACAALEASAGSGS